VAAAEQECGLPDWSRTVRENYLADDRKRGQKAEGGKEKPGTGEIGGANLEGFTGKNLNKRPQNEI